MNNTHSQKFFISANESNPEAELAVNVLVSNIIEVATSHANSLGIGNPAMESLGAGWVLSRLTLEMTRYPKCNTSYVIETWVENWNRHFSTRDFAVIDESGETVGYARSIWMVLDMTTHANYGLSHLTLPDGTINDRPCAVTPQEKHVEILPFGTNPAQASSKALVANVPDMSYTFKYNDIDFYRHVNTVRYITLLLNQYTLSDFDANFVSRLELSFLHEGSFGDTVAILRHNFSALAAAYSIYSPAKQTPILFARLTLTPRHQ